MKMYASYHKQLHIIIIISNIYSLY